MLELFIVLTIGFTVAILLSTGLMFVIMLNKYVMKWYMKYICKAMKNMDDVCSDVLSEDL